MKEKAAFEELTKELRGLVVMTILCYCKHRSGLRQVKVPTDVIRYGNDYGIAAESYVLAGAVINSVI